MVTCGSDTNRPSPRFLFLQTNQRCNLKCTHCAYWKLNDDGRASYLTTPERLAFLSAFKAIGGEAMVTCGGEPMLDLEDFFALTVGCRERGLRCLSVVNGTRIANDGIAERILLEGPSEITISLDHWQPRLNDHLRGVAGAHAVASRAVKLLVAARKRLGVDVPIYVMTILSEDTWPSLFSFFGYVLKGLGADKLKLNVIQPSFQGTGPDQYFAGSRVSDVEACMARVRKCDEVFGITRNPEWLADVEMYLRSIQSPLLGWNPSRRTERAICNSYDRNIMLDLYGNARLCFSELYPSTKVSPDALKEFWFGSSVGIRNAMVGCKQYCGISHSVRRTESTLKKGTDE